MLSQSLIPIYKTLLIHMKLRNQFTPTNHLSVDAHRSRRISCSRRATVAPLFGV
ncbi:hypothetical protein BN903_22 [Halorubrum sp. AJ67]|nr:hypothetical protein BN903_22 [Halorubrum sp. AJ67]